MARGVFGCKEYCMACVVCSNVVPRHRLRLPSCFSPARSGPAASFAPSAGILVDAFPPAKRASAFALYTVAIVTAPAIGPVLGGWITDNYNRRWVFLINIPIGLASLYLTHRFVHDPPAFSEERKTVRTNGKLNVDTLGIALIAVGSAALEILLDRGQIDDWFGSTFICWMAAIGIGCILGAIYWELRVPDPVIDFRLLKTRNFAIACVFYFVFGFGLFASTTMIPQLLQSLYSYRAIDAGLVLGPGAFVITLLAPVGAQLVQRRIIHPRILLFGAVIVVGISMIHYSHFNLQTDYNHYSTGPRVAGARLRLLLCPAFGDPYSELKPNQNNKASSLTNFFRNWGGSFGIAFITTMAERRQNFHQSRVGGNLTASSSPLQSAIRQTAAYLQIGYSQVDAMKAATLHYYSELWAQSRLLAFMDCFHIIGVVTLVAAPLVWLTRNFKVGGGPSASH